jgi:hypothetical protein
MEVEPGEELELVAVLGARRGVSKVLALKDQTVEITLKSPPKKAPPKGQQKLCEVPGPGGLKIFRPCD